MRIVRKIKNSMLIRGIWRFTSNIWHTIIGKNQFAQCADDVIITPPYHFENSKNIFLGPKIGIGPNAHISATNAKFICKGNCAIAEGLTVHTGNHARLIGKFITDITEANKPNGYDKDVIVENDVWIGSNVTILSGVTISRGTTVAAGAVVNRSTPPYSIVGGVPAKFIKFYWSIEQILEHEAQLYPEEERFSKEKLEQIYNDYKR